MRLCALIPSVLHSITLVRLARRDVKERMWTKAHRARHEARLKDRVRVSTVGAVVRWLALRQAQEGGSAALAAAHPAAPDCRSAGLGLARGRPVAGAARRFPAVAHRLWLVPTLAGGWRFRCLDAGDRPPAPSIGGPARGAAPVHHRYAGGSASACAGRADTMPARVCGSASAWPWWTPPGTGSRSP